MRPITSGVSLISVICLFMPTTTIGAITNIRFRPPPITTSTGKATFSYTYSATPDSVFYSASASGKDEAAIDPPNTYEASVDGSAPNVNNIPIVDTSVEITGPDNVVYVGFADVSVADIGGESSPNYTFAAADAGGQITGQKGTLNSWRQSVYVGPSRTPQAVSGSKNASGIIVVPSGKSSFGLTDSTFARYAAIAGTDVPRAMASASAIGGWYLRSLPQTPLNQDSDVVKNAIVVLSNGGPYMRALFVPNTGSIDDANRLCGVDHWNWISWTVTDSHPPSVHGSPAVVPYLDPPTPDGWDYQRAAGILEDNKPEYWNEDNGEVGLHTTANSLEFLDAPSTNGAAVRSKTILVGVNHDGVPLLFKGSEFIDWTAISHGSPLAKNVDLSLITDGTVTLNGLFPISQLSDSDLQFLQGIGVSIVPEPNTAALSCAGVCCVIGYGVRRRIVGYRWRRSRTVAKAIPLPKRQSPLKPRPASSR